MKNTRLCSTPALLLTASWIPAALASPLVSVSYEAPDAAGGVGPCPSAIEFTRALQARGADVGSPEARARARAVDARIRRIDGAFVGDLIVHSPAGGAATRTVHDAQCSEVASALALTAAIALGGSGDPSGGADVATHASASAAPMGEFDGVAAEEAVPPEAELEPSAPPSPARSTPRLRGSSFEQTDSLAVSAGTLELEGARAYTLTAGVHAGLIPGELLPRYDLTASLAGFLIPPGGESRLFGPVLQVHWAVLGPVTTRHRGVTLDTWGLEAGINSCSAVNYDTAGFVGLLCAEFGAGWLFMDAGRSAPGSEEQTRGYGFGGLAFDAQYNLASWAHLGARVGGRLTTSLEAEGPDGASLFETSNWAGYATIGFGIHF